MPASLNIFTIDESLSSSRKPNELYSYGAENFDGRLSDASRLQTQKLRDEMEVKFMKNSDDTLFEEFGFGRHKEELTEKEFLKKQELYEKKEKEFEKRLALAEYISKKAAEKGGKNSTLRFLEPSLVNVGRRPKACLLFTITSHSKFHTLEQIVQSIQQIEQTFNSNFNYPYVFITENEFTSEQKKEIESIVSAPVLFGTIPKKYFQYPSWIDQNKAATARSKMHNLEFGSSASYRFVQRYLAGFLWKHELLQNFDWFWRIQPDVELFCEMQYDIFRWMQDTGNLYGFTLFGREEIDTMPSIWNLTEKFNETNSDYGETSNLMHFGYTDNGEKYRTCHFLPVLEMGNLNLWKSPAYSRYFDFLDHEGGIFYERWSDAVIRTLAVTSLIPKDRIHFFPEIGFSYNSLENCPIDDFVWKDNDCRCDQGNDFTFKKDSCTGRFYEAKNMKKPEGWKT